MSSTIETVLSTLHLTGKTIVITGASSGVGRATAIAFARHGATLILAGRNIEALEDVENICREMGSSTITVRADVTDAEQMKKLAAIAAEYGDGIDVWVNNAGVMAAGTFDTTPIQVHEKVIATNLQGYINGAYAAVPFFKRQLHGILINNISVGGWFPVPYGAAYSASKFGLRGFSAALRGELQEYPLIYVCDIYPPFLDTPGIQHAANYTGKVLKPAPPVYNPQKVANAIVSLAERPRNSLTIGSIAHLLKICYALLPSISIIITGKIMRGYLKTADTTQVTNGNLFEPANFGNSIHGGWNSDADAAIRKKKVINTMTIAGFATGLMLTLRYLSRKSRSFK